MEHFPKKQIKVIVFDDFKDNTETVVRDVLTFLELDPTQMPNLINHNANTKMRSQRLARIIQDPSHPITSVSKRLLPKFIWKRGKVLLTKINTDHSPRTPLDEDFKQQLRLEAQSHVANLQAYLHQEGLSSVDLMNRWGYSIDNNL